MTGGLSESLGKSGWGIRPVLVAVVISVFLVASSSYIALKLGALPWPIIFSVIASAGLLRLFGRFNSHELNVAHAGASMGGLMASALVFTIPGMWYLASQGETISFATPLTIFLLCLSGGLLGVIVSLPIRNQLVDKLPYPSGSAGAELILAGFKGGKIIRFALIAGLLAAIFALSRDLWFPAGWVLLSVGAVVIAFYPMPLAAGVGYILGPHASFSWFAGSIVGWVFILPFIVPLVGDGVQDWIKNLGMGLLLGAGLGFLIHYLITRLKHFKIKKPSSWAVWYASLFAVIVLYLVEVPFLASVLTVLSTILVVFVAARMTGETNIDPLEQFGIVIGLLVALIYGLFHLDLSLFAKFMIVTFTSIAAAIAGDIGHDYKAARIIGTKPKDVYKVAIVSVIAVSIAGPFVLEIIRTAYASQLFTAIMPAPQAQLVAGSIAGFAFPSVFLFGLLIGAVYEIVIRITKKNYLMMMPFAIGLFLGIPLGILLLIGGLLAIYAKKKGVYKEGIIISAGIMGGEGIAGFLSGALIVLGIAKSEWLLGLFGLVLIGVLLGILLKQKRLL